MKEHEIYELILAEFPATSAEETAELAGRITEAHDNVLGILRAISTEINDSVLDLVTRYMDDVDLEAQYYLEEKTLPHNFGSGYSYDSGFTPLQASVLTYACEVLEQQSLELTHEQLTSMRPWIEAAENMGLQVKLQSWADCEQESQRWQRNIINSEDPTDAPYIVGHTDGQFTAWNVAIDTRHLDQEIIVAITDEYTLIKESLKVDPEFWKRYINECIKNRARPFSLIDNETATTIEIILLRYRKQRWYVAQPSRYSINSIPVKNTELLEKKINAFAKDYNER